MGFWLGAEFPRLKALRTAKTVVPANTAQFNAAIAVPAFAIEQTMPKQMRSLRKTASAMNPPNQNSMVTPSMAANAYLCIGEVARCGNFSGTTMSGMRTMRVQTGEKTRKLISMGETWRQWLPHHVATARLSVSACLWSF